MPSLAPHQSELLLYCKVNNLSPPGYYPDFDERGRWLCSVVVGGKPFEADKATDMVQEAKERCAEVALKGLSTVNDVPSVVATTPLSAGPSTSPKFSTVSATSTSASVVVRSTPSSTSPSTASVTTATATAMAMEPVNGATVDRAANVALLQEEFFACLARVEKLTEDVSAHLARASSGNKGRRSDVLSTSAGKSKKKGRLGKEEAVTIQNGATVMEDGEVKIEGGSVFIKTDGMSYTNHTIERTIPHELSTPKGQKRLKTRCSSAPLEGAPELIPEADSSTAQSVAVALQPIPDPAQARPCFRTFILSGVATEPDEMAVRKVLTRDFGKIVSMRKLQGKELFLIKIRLHQETAPVSIGNLPFDGTIRIKRPSARPATARIYPKDKSCACCWGKGHDHKRCPKISENRKIYKAEKAAKLAATRRKAKQRAELGLKGKVKVTKVPQPEEESSGNRGDDAIKSELHNGALPRDGTNIIAINGGKSEVIYGSR